MEDRSSGINSSSSLCFNLLEYAVSVSYFILPLLFLILAEPATSSPLEQFMKMTNSSRNHTEISILTHCIME